MASATRIDMDYCTSFADAKTTNIAQHLLMSYIMRRAGLVSCMRHVCVTEFDLHNAVRLEYYDSSAASTFGVTHV